MPVGMNPLPPLNGSRLPAASGSTSGTDDRNGSPSDLDRQLNRARQALAAGDLSPADAARLRSLLAMARKALDRGDQAAAERYAEEAEKTTGAAPDAPPADPAGKPSEKEGAPEDGDAQRLGEGDRRTYQDASGDPGVSFKQPTAMTPGQAEILVRFHERQHLRRDTQEAKADGRKVVSAYTAIQYGTDPATGERYIKGGRTVIRTAPDAKARIDRKA